MWKKITDWIIYPKFIWALMISGKLNIPDEKRSGSLDGWSDVGLTYLIEEGRRQLDDQMETLNRILLRAQILFATILAMFAPLATVAPKVWNPTKPYHYEKMIELLWILSAILLILALLGTAALISIQKQYSVISALEISGWHRFDLQKLAKDYADSIGLGDDVNNAHLSAYGTAVRFTLSGAVGLGIIALVTFFNK